MAPEITAEAISARARAPSYEELYGTAPRSKPKLEPKLRRQWHVPRTATALSIILALLMGVIATRAAIVRWWPQTNALFAAAGLKVNQRGLDLQHVRVNLVHDAAQPLLVVDGDITNERSEKVDVPELRLAVRDAQGQDIYTWDTPSPKTKLEGGETIAFRARLAAPPADGHDVFVRFADRAKSAH